MRFWQGAFHNIQGSFEWLLGLWRRLFSFWLEAVRRGQLPSVCASTEEKMDTDTYTKIDRPESERENKSERDAHSIWLSRQHLSLILYTQFFQSCDFTVYYCLFSLFSSFFYSLK